MEVVVMSADSLFPAGAEAKQAYDEIRAGYRWRIPETFNFGTDVVDYWAREQDGPALIWENAAGEGCEFTFSDMARLTNKFGSMLRAHGIDKGDRVIIMLPRIPEWMTAMVGALKIGAIPIPCIEMLTARDLEYRVCNSQARAVVCRAGEVQKFAGVIHDIPVRLALGGASGWLDVAHEMVRSSVELEPARMAAEDPAIMYYTSGSTGHPKAVMHAARALYAWRMSAIYWLDLRPGDRIWCTADTGWSKAGTSILFGPWSCGVCSFLYDGPFVPNERLRLLAKHGITVYCASSTELFRLLEEEIEGHDLTAMRRTVSAGESVNPVVAMSWQRATRVRVDEAYGLTETLMLVLNLPGEPVKYGSMGRASPGSDVDVIDASGRRLPCGEEGDIAVLTPNPQMMLGYWKDEERTISCYIRGPDGLWYVTGDRGARDEDGYLWYRGRSDDLINSAGYRIGPLEVENILLECASVQSCAVIGSPDPQRGEIVKAFVVLRAGTSPSEALTRQLQEHVKSTTAPYKYPRAIEYVDQLPLTVTGKINRRSLRERDRSSREGQ
jgi:acyl-coenzyme A synthetase/AMP-(fatty) acid ligase